MLNNDLGADDPEHRACIVLTAEPPAAHNKTFVEQHPD
jgi:hypothetical protein